MICEYGIEIKENASCSYCGALPNEDCRGQMLTQLNEMQRLKEEWDEKQTQTD